MKLDAKHWFYIFISICFGIFIIVLFLIPELTPEEPAITEVKYNYFTFKKAGPVWDTLVKYEGKILQPSFRFLPGEVENVTVKGNLDKAFARDTVYLTFDPLTEQSQFQTMAIAVSEMGMNLQKGLGKQISSACTRNETEACINRTIIQCKDTNESVIFFNPVGEPEVILEGMCVELRGSGFDLLKSVDRVLYAWYGIIKQNIILPNLLPQ